MVQSKLLTFVNLKKMVEMNRKKMFFRLLLSFSFLIIITNYYSRSLVVRSFLPGDDLTFESSDCGFKYHLVTFKGKTVETMKSEFRRYKLKNNINELNDIKIYRTFDRKVWKFWLWREYMYRNVYTDFEYHKPCERG